MSDALFQTLPTVRTTPATRRKLPAGYGLLIGAAASLGLWGGVVWAVALALG